MFLKHFVVVCSNVPSRACSLRMYSAQKRSKTVLMMGAHQNKVKNHEPCWNRKEELIDAHRHFYPEFVTDLLDEFKDEKFAQVRNQLEELCYYVEPHKREIHASLFMLYPYVIFEKPGNLTTANFKRVSKLAWCFEMLDTLALTIDDMLDGTDTRWKKPSWHKRNDIGLSAINDFIAIRLLGYRVIKRHFRSHPSYEIILKSFRESFDAICAGETYDLCQTAAFKESRNLELFTMDAYNKMCILKSHLPVAGLPLKAIMALTNNLDQYYKIEHMLVPTGIHPQIMNDTLDAFGSYENFGKFSVDISEGKHSWVITKALECANEGQKQLLKYNYARSEPECHEVVNKIYKELDLIQRYYDYKNQLMENAYNELKKVNNPGVHELIETILGLCIDTDDDLTYDC